MSERMGDWFVTFGGRRFYPFDPRVEDIHIEDIAHALSLQTRWMGQCKRFYSIADHSLMCMHAVIMLYSGKVDFLKWALLHDAVEAYTGDIIRPIKRSLVVDLGLNAIDFKEFENRLLKLVAERFGLCWPIPEEIHIIDNRMLVTEALELTSFRENLHWAKTKPWADIQPLDVDLPHRDPRMTELAFMQAFNELFEIEEKTDGQAIEARTTDAG